MLRVTGKFAAVLTLALGTCVCALWLADDAGDDHEPVSERGLIPTAIARFPGQSLTDEVLKPLHPEVFAEDAESRQARVVVSSSSLVENLSIVGRLGHPIGSLVTIRGIWHVPGPKGPDFEVTHINGARLTEPVFFSYLSNNVESPELRDYRPLDGEVWERRAFESGEFFGVPHDAFVHELASIGMWEFGFTTRLICLGPDADDASPGGVEEDRRHNFAVSWSSVLYSASIVGRLERPIGTMLAIRGVWHLGDASEPHFEVTRINDVRVEELVRFRQDSLEQSLIGFPPGRLEIQPGDGEVWEMQAFESGEFVGLPSEVLESKEGNQEAEQLEFGFETKLVAVGVIQRAAAATTTE